MPDWKQYIRENLSLSKLSRQREEEIIEDLAWQFQSAYREALSRGMPDEEASTRAKQHIPDWESFVSDVYRSERRNSKPSLDKWHEISRSESYTLSRGGEKILMGFTNDLWKDTLYALRVLGKNPGFTLVVVLVLALGIGANTAIFSLVHAVLLDSLPYENPDRLVILWNEYKKMNLQASNSVPDYLDRKEQSETLEDVAVFTITNVNLAGSEEPVRVLVSPVTSSFFSVLGVKAAMGRTFTAEEDEPGKDSVALLSHGTWQKHFGGDPGIIGEKIELDGKSRTVVGVLPASFNLFFLDAEVLYPLAFTPEQMSDDRRGQEYLIALGRVKEGISIGQVDAEMQTIAARVIERFPNRAGFLVDAGWTASATPLREQLIGKVRPALLVLAGAVGLVLLIACANIANLLLARTNSRNKEFAIRASLGADRSRLIRQLLTESVLLSLAGGGLGILLARVAVKAAGTITPAGFSVPVLNQLSISVPVLLFALAVSISTGILFGLFPALTSSKTDLQSTLKEGGRTSGSASTHRMRNVLLVTEVSIALVLLVGAGLLLRSVQKLLEVNPGFQTENRLTFQINLPAFPYDTRQKEVEFFRALMPRLNALPGVRTAGATRQIPLGPGGGTRSFVVEGYEAPEGESMPLSETRVITSGYIRAMGISLLQGREFEDRDDENARKVVLVDEKTVRRFWANESPLGKRIRYGSDGPWREVIGVVGSVKSSSLDAEGREQIYLPYSQAPASTMYVVLHTETAPTSLLSAARNVVREMDANVPISEIRTVDTILNESVALRRYAMMAVLVFALTALLLASVGLYGVISHMIGQRTHEIGIRMALGARRADIFHLVIRQGLLLTLTGVVIGLGISLGLSRFLTSLLFGINAIDPVTFLGIPLLFSAVAFLACLIPSMRATRVDPMVALRYE